MDDKEKEVKRAALRSNLLELNTYNRPMVCSKCGGIMIFKGVGEYKCEDCGHLEYDDYGKVRNYVEKHVGATSAQVSEATGVSQRSIRDMLRESRLEIAPESRTFLQCEICGASIRSGRFCPKCEENYHRSIEEQARENRKSGFTGHSTEKVVAEDGTRRFTRDR